jgi:hypothetical protein
VTRLPVGPLVGGGAVSRCAGAAALGRGRRRALASACLMVSGVRSDANLDLGELHHHLILVRSMGL